MDAPAAESEIGTDEKSWFARERDSGRLYRYAGLATFSQLEPDIAKLDMSLIRGIDTAPKKASIVRSMISVCREDLGTSVVCEGVETRAERETLEGLGADLLQGYLFGRPQRDFRSLSIFAPALVS